MKKYVAAAVVALGLAACSTQPGFKVEGSVSEADGKMLYLEASALDGIVPLDSVKLSGDGTFAFKQNRPESPEFYRLRVDDKVINFSIDSTETVNIQATYAGFATSYQVSGSPNSVKIKELTLKQMDLQEKTDELFRQMRAHQIGTDVLEDSMTALVNRYKNDVKVKYIFAAPYSAAAYFALFQRLNGNLIFNPLGSKDDVKCFAAVATSLNNFYPHANRSKNLYNIVIKGMQNTRTSQQKVVEIPQNVVSETGIIDIDLRDISGNVRKLTDLKGKVVILDFTIYQTTVSAAHNYMLLDLYNKYASRGLEIYQVSLDTDEHYWKTIADNLPWICVRDPNGSYSTYATTYNVQSVPTLFIVNKNNELSARGETIKDLEATIKALL